MSGQGDSGAGGPPNWDDDAFRARVTQLAAARGMSVAEVCRRAGLSASYLAKPAGQQGRSVVALLGIAKALNVSLLELIGTMNYLNAQPTDENLARLALVAEIASYLYVALGARRHVPITVDTVQLTREIMRVIEELPSEG